MPSTTCMECGRGLKEPASVERGMGPVCAAKYAARRSSSRDMFTADYDVVKVAEDMVWIVDLDRGNRSVTNDAERVVAELAKQYGERRIIYRDSMGRWDELVHEAGRFTGYRPVPACFALA